MICFLVPVKSKKLSSDWEKFSKLVDRSLKSINGQKDKNFQIVVACHEFPENRLEHPQVHYVKVDFPPPTLTQSDREKDRQLKEGDKAQKITSAFEYANKNFSVDYYMVVDSDDCIHNGISEYVNAKIESNIPGWYFKKGYFYREGKQMAFLNRLNFNNVCGTCIIIRKDLFNQLIVKKPFLYYFHEKTVLEANLALIPYPKAGAIYSMANGENHLMSQQNIKNLINSPKLFTKTHIKSIYSKLSKYRPRYMSNRFKKAFNFYPVT